MRPGARIAAAIEVLTEVVERHRPVSLALADWGKAHRFAGSGDRSAIGNLVYDALRRRASLAWAMGSDTPRAMAIGAAPDALGLDPDAVAALCTGEDHAPLPLDDAERQGLVEGRPGAPPHIQADVPEWLWPAFESQFGDRAVAEGQAFTRRAPADLRVNTLRSTKEKVAKALASFGVVATPFAPTGLRIPAPEGPGRTPNLQAEAAFQAGWFEVQDEGSQIAALLTGAGPRMQILDLCAGAGGKSLAMAAAMQSTGQIYAYDDDRERLKPIFERMKRAFARNVQVLRARDREALAALGARFDVVLVDAPCTGTGVWRRRPEAKWRLRPNSLETRTAEQKGVLDTAATHVKPGGRLVYVTCSILPDENRVQVQAFLERHPSFRLLPFGEAWHAALSTAAPRSADGSTETLLLTPESHGTDGFFIAILQRSDE
ncbi:MAG: RsmB/NOP family class I SAM-dependent RNA methyltransferase [Hyphomicrobiaceae bacterium]|nr:RsmB/NOP family class I SAM-dependent RNA methyltransferase [Hyphomicrobiaceae bacterium]